MTDVFIDGSAGTTGLRIYERLADRKDIHLITLSDELRKDTEARRAALNSADIAFLCLPDAAAKEAVSLVSDFDTAIIDTSTAHRTESEWTYGFPELVGEKAIKASKRIANPGCHASGFTSCIASFVSSFFCPNSTYLSPRHLLLYSIPSRHSFIFSSSFFVAIIHIRSEVFRLSIYSKPFFVSLSSRVLKPSISFIFDSSLFCFLDFNRYD